MRRNEMEIKDPSAIKNFLDSQEILRIGFNDNSDVYIVPVNYGYTLENDNLIFYGHGAVEGRKANLLKSGFQKVGFEIDGNSELVPNKNVCASTYKYASVIGNGIISEIIDPAEKIYAMSNVVNHLTGEQHEFTETMLSKTLLFKIEVTSYSLKATAGKI